MLIGIMILLYRTFQWEQVVSAYQSVPQGDSLLHPFRSDGVSAFDPKFFFIHVYYWMIYSVLSWSPNTMLVGSARDAHEARMMRVMLNTRNLAMMGLGLMILPMAAFVLMNHPDFAAQAAEVHGSLARIDNEQGSGRTTAAPVWLIAFTRPTETGPRKSGPKERHFTFLTGSFLDLNHHGGLVWDNGLLTVSSGRPARFLERAGRSRPDGGSLFPTRLDVECESRFTTAVAPSHVAQFWAPLTHPHSSHAQVFKRHRG